MKKTIGILEFKDFDAFVGGDEVEKELNNDQ